MCAGMLISVSQTHTPRILRVSGAKEAFLACISIEVGSGEYGGGVT